MEEGSEMVSGFLPAIRCTCSWASPEHIAKHRVPQLYGPDGVPLDGPRTTAAEYTNWYAHYDGAGAPHDYEGWRNAAAYEGDRYIEALRGARAMRSAADLRTHRFCDHDDATSFLERSYGIPAVWHLF